MNFDRIARAYRWIEYAAFGGDLERSRFALLDRLAGSEHVLTLGEGDGRALARLLTFAPQVQIDVLDSSAAMISAAGRRTLDSNRVRFHRTDALNACWPKNVYDGIMTLFFLDCFSADETDRLVQQVTQSIAPGALWLVADFAIPERGWRRWHARVWIGVMYRFFAVTTGMTVRCLPPIEPILRKHGWQRLELVERRAGLIRSELWQKTTLF